MKKRLVSLRRYLIPAATVGILCAAGCSQSPRGAPVGESRPRGELRRQVEARLPALEEAFVSSPHVDQNRRAYAEILFKVGRMGEAREIIAPLANEGSPLAEDALLGARLAYFLGDYAGAEMLFRRVKDSTPPGLESRLSAIEGLVLVYYQINRYDRVRELELAELKGRPDDESALAAFMSQFTGIPYRVTWLSTEKAAHLPIVNDIAPADALPLVRLRVNAQTVEFILDTGGDRMYVDESVARRIGIKTVTTRRAKYAYTGGKSVTETFGVAESVEMDAVKLENVPVIVAKWKAMGQKSDGVITTQILRQFLTTVDYDRKEIVFRERGEAGWRKMRESLAAEPVRIPFWLASTHLMFTRGSINDHSVNLLVDSGLAASMPMIVANETVQDLGLIDRKTEINGTRYYWVPIDSYGMGSMRSGGSQALGNVLVEEDPYWGLGFIADALISHQYLRHLGSWTIDFDGMSYYFPADAGSRSN
jgi:hypothetical protein